MTTIHTVQTKLNGNALSIETGKVAKQADGAVVVRCGGTMVLSTVVAARSPMEGRDRDFLPLTVEYREKAYAGGKIPGGFFKREGRPDEKETLTCRLIDRPIRPLFPKGFRNEIQVINLVISADNENDPDVLAMIGTSAALSISGIPFAGPIGAARVAMVDGKLVKKAKEDGYFDKVDKTEGRQLIVDKGIRVEGRRVKEVRPIWSEVRYLTRANGSTLFTRGGTQALVTATLGTKNDEQKLESF